MQWKNKQGEEGHLPGNHEKISSRSDIIGESLRPLVARLRSEVLEIWYGDTNRRLCSPQRLFRDKNRPRLQ